MGMVDLRFLVIEVKMLLRVVAIEAVPGITDIHTVRLGSHQHRYTCSHGTREIERVWVLS
jgi:hypothetical protein